VTMGGARSTRIVGRMLSMPIAELAWRGRQGASIWLERVGMIDAPNGHRPEAHGCVHAVPARFFAGATAHAASAAPEIRGRVMADADRLCAGRFDLLGYRDLSFGEPIDWHLDAVSGRRAPFVHWSRIDPLDPATVGDSKVVWELNRHQWFVRLGQAYRLTHDELYAAAFVSAIRSWMECNPRGMGINWASSLEAALRLVSWCWATLLFRGSRWLSEELRSDILVQIEAHARHVERHLSYYFSPNTHLTGEALGLFYAGAVCAESDDARRWREIGARILVDEIERQVADDGVYFEQSTYYQRYTVDIYLHFLILAARNGIPVPGRVGDRVQQMLDFLLAVRRPDGTLPQIGDADGGRIMPFVHRAADDARDLFSTAAAFFRRSDYAWAAGVVAPDTFWLLGAEGVRAFTALQPAPPIEPPSRLFGDGGYAVMRSGWEPDAHQMIVDVGPLGCPHSGAHGHADLLSVQCAAFGEPYLVDAGTCCYTGETAWRDFFRGSAAHSTIVIDGIAQAVPAGPFAWQNRPRARVRRWVSTETYDLVDADHDAYRDLPDPVVHRRRVLFVGRRYWVVVDDLDGRASHRVDVRFQCAPIAVHADAAPWVRARGRNGHALLIGAFTTVPVAVRIANGRVAPTEGWTSADYGQRSPAPVVVYSVADMLPLRIVTLLLPTVDPSAAPPSISLVPAGDGRPASLVFTASGETIAFD
jgi:uncharacterized heparinase superfamily protein